MQRLEGAAGPRVSRVPLTITQADLDYATELVRRSIGPTPQHQWPLLSEAVGAEVWVKHENHTLAGAFKVRGGLVYMDRLVKRRPDAPGIISATRGNHGQSLAYAGRSAGLAVTVVVPEGNSPDKNAAMRGFGATVVEFGHDFDEARVHAAHLAEQGGLEFVPAFHPDLVLGVATYARELFEGVDNLDAVYVPVGMGSGICALIGVRDLLGLRTEVVGVVSEKAPAAALSFEARSVVTTSTAETFVDGVACRVPDPLAVETMVKGASRVITVSEDDAATAMRLLFATTHNVPEPAGALALAGLMSERERMAGKRVAIVQTGGNADSAMLADVLEGRTPSVGRQLPATP
jgi:threonine dehydratase